MRLTFVDQASAQIVADRIHQSMITANADYAADVTAGHTLRWAAPYLDIDYQGNVIGTSWHVAVNDRCKAVLTAQEVVQAYV